MAASLFANLPGLLGPDAVSLTYHSSSGQLVSEQTAGADGAYLVLGPPTGVDCSPSGDCTNGDTSVPGLTPGFVDSVTYRGGYVCQIDKLGERQAGVVARSRATYVREPSCPLRG